MVTQKRAKQKIRRVTRRAVNKGMDPLSRAGGLGITRNEGSAALQRAIKKVGYQKARKIVGRTERRYRRRTGQ